MEEIVTDPGIHVITPSTPIEKQVNRYIGKGHGIQGHQNSCYLDATVFGLFALSSVFDSMLAEDSEDPAQQEVRELFRNGIVNPLRK